MKVAVAGSGDLSHYLFEELRQHGHEVFALVRNRKSFLDDLKIEQRVSDFTLGDLDTKLADCDAVVSVISGRGQDHVDVHLSILEACKRSKNCKKFIPSEWTINVEDYPEHPIYSAEGREAIRKALAAQTEVQWTIIINGWFMDYMIPGNQRHISDFPDGYFIDHKNKTFILPDKGSARMSMTAARDVARATAALLDQGEWEPHIHMAGETLSMIDFFNILHETDSSWKTKEVRMGEIVTEIVKKEKNGDPAIFLYLDLLGFSGSNEVRVEKAHQQRQKYFPDVRFRQVREFLGEAKAQPDAKIV